MAARGRQPQDRAADGAARPAGRRTLAAAPASDPHPGETTGAIPARDQLDGAAATSFDVLNDVAAGAEPGLTSRVANDSAGAQGQRDGEGSEPEGDRSGVDARRRGWFWHWNSVVTQYAPLIGLKGVGLLNSYTVWTDRRDESPHRGYAFPSQQSEADFYGEERAELIAINKILVALDLIEIRKEMVLRVDERGRRWKVPHNLYRVKDRPDGVNLRAADVIRVAEIAREDAAVFRHVRRVFSPRFKPIDRDNVWHDILAELADHPVWVELRERTAELETRASARTRAGHRTRSRTAGTSDDSPEGDATSATTAATANAGSAFAAPETIDAHDASQHEVNDVARLSVSDEHTASRDNTDQTSVAGINTGFDHDRAIDVADANRGWGVDVASANDGSDRDPRTVEAAGNSGRPSAVAPGNTTYHQALTTTTTTTTTPRVNVGANTESDEVLDEPIAPTPGTTSSAEPKDSAALAEASARPPVNGVAAASGSARAAQAGPTEGVGGDGQDAGGAATRAGRAGRAEPADRAGAVAESSAAARQRPAVAGLNVESETQDVDGGRGKRGDAGGDEALDADWEWESNEDWGEGAVMVAAVERGRVPGGDAPRSAVASGQSSAEPAGGPGAGEQHGVGRLAHAAGAGPLGDPGPLVVSLFEAANDRKSTPLERILLAELERDADAVARACGSSGTEWVAAALREAVASGSAFVAPKRIREIITRWARESSGPGAGTVSVPVIGAGAVETQPAAADALVPAAAVAAGETVRLPGGARGDVVWSETLAALARALDPAAFERLLAGSEVARFRRGVVEVRVASAAAAAKLSTEYRALVERCLNARLPRPVSVSFVVAEVDRDDGAMVNDDVAAAMEHGNCVIAISPADYDLAVRVWQAVADDLAGALPPRDARALSSVVPLGEDTGGVMLLGTTTAQAQRLVDGRCRAEIQRALGALLGREVVVRAIAGGDWRVATGD